MSTPEADRAAARRAFIRSAHPDAGGDTAAFVAGLAEFDRLAALSSGIRPSIHRSRRPDRVLGVALQRVRRRLAGLPPRDLH